MRGGRLCLAAVVYVCLSFLFLPLGQAADCWRLDEPEGNGLVRNFRASTDALTDDEAMQGQDDLYISGSGQPSAGELVYLRTYLAELADMPVYLLDLRQESHFYTAGAAVSWYKDKNQANAGMDAAAVEKVEAGLAQAVSGQNIEALPLGNEDKAFFTTAYFTEVQPIMEREAAESAGFHYVRIAATDQMWPEPHAVDAFLSFYRSLPPYPVWLHFHCQAGHGRTTIFMTMYDILKNPELSLEYIVTRQKLLGGTDGLAEAVDDGSWRSALSNDKVFKLRLFYRYVQENKAAGFKCPWSEWLIRQGV